MNSRSKTTRRHYKKYSRAGATVLPEALENSFQESAAVSKGTQSPDLSNKHQSLIF